MGCNCGGSQRQAVTASAKTDGPATWSGPDRGKKVADSKKSGSAKSGSAKKS